ncbi:hypothetical protein RLDS_16685 [Sphingobium lactosutens DS20]|uniref:Uncharacterized protein n=1 Tax=Sphingobium lactosutens DS20 TaxID=1331060 RepID=T0IUN9_9SPHN|nr:hypothetical protein RLDS_16685 [Sphingobium lactosutens DS20]
MRLILGAACIVGAGLAGPFSHIIQSMLGVAGVGLIIPMRAPEQ